MNSPLRDEARGGCVMIGVPQPGATVERLRARRVLCDWRPGVGLRLSAHFFNSDEEILEALEILAGILA